MGKQKQNAEIFFIRVAIAMFMQGTQKERPLTHDPVANIFRALVAKIERAIVNDLKCRPVLKS